MSIRLPKGAQIVGFADDIALVVRGKHLDALVRMCNNVGKNGIDYHNGWEW